MAPVGQGESKQVTNMPTVEQKLLTTAIHALELETGLKLKAVDKPGRAGNTQYDGIVVLPNKAGKLAVEVKKWAQHANFGALAAQIKGLPQEGLLVADYVNPKMGQRLKAQGVQFLDTAGNCYINKPPTYIWVNGNKPAIANGEAKEDTNRVFEATGLKVVFALLCQPNLVQQSYREIAQAADVALGSVSWVITGLREGGFLIDRGKGKKRVLTNLPKLFMRWVEAYPEKLKPKLKIGDFTAPDYHWWQSVDIEQFGGLWGGEVAAFKLAKYLQPEQAVVYMPEAEVLNLVAKARLKKSLSTHNEESKVALYQPFWQPATNAEEGNKLIKGVTHPILIYADLIATGDVRDREAAQDIYDRHIAEHLE